jgi:hypothetical protein
LQGRGWAGAGQGGQTFSVTLRITDLWPQSGFGNFDLLLLLVAAVSKDIGRRSRAPTGDFTVAFGYGHPLVIINLSMMLKAN